MQKLAIRLWDTVAKDTVGNLLRPWQIRREGRAHAEVRREEMLLLGQAEQDLQAIREGRKHLTNDLRLETLPDPGESQIAGEHHSPKANETSLNTVLNDAEKQAALDRTQAQINLAKTVRYAEEEVENDTSEPPDDSVDWDWFHRWREGAQSVTTEELQRLWARTLAGEIKAPGTYSLRTLDFLRNLTSEEARKIQQLAAYVFAGAIFDDCQSEMESEGLTFSDLLHVQELGVLEGVDSISTRKNFSSIEENAYKAHLVGYTKVIEVTGNDPSAVLSLNMSPITRLGTQVLSLGEFESDKGLAFTLASKIMKQGFTAQVGDWEPLTDGTARGYVKNLRDVPDNPD